MASAHELMTSARIIADDLLFPNAAAVDQTANIPPTHFDALAAAGLFGLAGPPELGGTAADPHTFRRIVATIAGGCGATFFVWVQHHGVVRTLSASPNPELSALVPDLCSGTTIAGTAFAHLRRPTAAVTAQPSAADRAGWVLSGSAPWATSWGMADVFAFAAAAPPPTPDDAMSTTPPSAAGERVLWAIVRTGEERTSLPDGVTPEALRLPVLGATGTVALHFDGATIDAEQVALLQPLERWRRNDRLRAALGQPASLGVAERAVSLLHDHGDADAASAAGRLTDQISGAWERDRHLVERSATITEADTARTATNCDDIDREIERFVTEASRHRAECLDLAHRSTTAALAAAGGRAMDLAHPAQRLAREAAFYVIQAQTADGRSATLLTAAAGGAGAATRRGAGTLAAASPRTS